jgi:hypothetical protein
MLDSLGLLGIKLGQAATWQASRDVVREHTAQSGNLGVLLQRNLEFVLVDLLFQSSPVNLNRRGCVEVPFLVIVPYLQHGYPLHP